MTASEFEDEVWAVENIRIVIRTDDSDQDVGDYDYTNAANARWRVSKWLERRVKRKLNEDHNLVLVDGSGEKPHRGTLLRTIRRSYDS